MPNKFKVEDFKPNHLKKAHITLDKHLKAAKEYEQKNDEYKKNLFNSLSLWDKIKHILHLN